MPTSIRDLVSQTVSFLENKPKLGSGKRFDQLVKKLKSEGLTEKGEEQLELEEGAARFCEEEDLREGRIRNPAALAAAIGRKKYGKSKFQAMAAAGRRRHG